MWTNDWDGEEPYEDWLEDREAELDMAYDRWRDNQLELAYEKELERERKEFRAAEDM